MLDRIKALRLMAGQGCDRFFRGPTAALIGPMGGREIIGVCRFASEE